MPDKKKKCLIYGNCQAMAIKSFMSRHPVFCEYYDVIELAPVHLLTSQDAILLDKIISTIDVFIYQPVAKNYKEMPKLSTNFLASKVKPNCQLISFPTAYFTGYHPEITYLRDSSGSVDDSPFPYHDLNIIELYSVGKSVEDVIKLIGSEDFYDFRYVRNNLEISLQKLNDREIGLTIQISDFIRKNLSQKKLFHTFNHPSAEILGFIFNSISKILFPNEDIDFFSSFAHLDALSRSSFPVYTSLYQALNLEFEFTNHYIFDKELFPQKKMIEAYFNYYDQINDKMSDVLASTVSRT